MAGRSPPPPAEELEAAARLLSEAERPLVIAGGGVRYSGAEAALDAIVQRCGFPVAETSAGKGVTAPGPLRLGGIGVNGSGAANRIAELADLVVCVGTRLTDFTTASRALFRHPGVRFLAINVCAADAHKLSATPVVADARLALEALAPRARPVPQGYRTAIATAREGWAAELAADIARGSPGRLTQGQVYAAVNATARAGDWVVAAAGWAPGDLLKAWSLPVGGHAHLEFGFSCMGHEIPAALGIRMQQGAEGEIFAIVGDGSFLMGPTELVTAVQENWKTTIVVIDNGGYGSIDRLAQRGSGTSLGNRFERRDGGPLPVDFAACAESFGCRGRRVDDLESLQRALADARASAVTTVIHCPVAPHRPLLDAGAFWDLGVPEVAGDANVRRLSAEHMQERATRRRHL